MFDGEELVSVIIPCFNQAHYLGEAIESVLAQTNQNFEVIVVDDGSPDDPAAVVCNFPRVRLVRQSNQGVSVARNAGLNVSRGKYLVFLDADDRLLPESLEAGVNALRSHPDCGFCYGRVRLIDHNGTPLPSPDYRPIKGEFYLTLLQRNDIWSPGQVIYRREVVIEAGGFDPEVASAADYDLNLRVARIHNVCSDHRYIFEYRVYGTSMSHNAGSMLTHTMRAYRSQWRHALRPPYREAFRSGRAAARFYYGERLIDELSQQLGKRDWKQSIPRILILIQFYPRGFARRIVKKVSRQL